MARCALIFMPGLRGRGRGLGCARGGYPGCDRPDSGLAFGARRCPEPGRRPAPPSVRAGCSSRAPPPPRGRAPGCPASRRRAAGAPVTSRSSRLGVGIAARVVVDQDQRRRGLAQRRAEDLARVHQAGRQRPLRHQLVTQHAMPPVEQHHQEALVGHVREASGGSGGRRRRGRGSRAPARSRRAASRRPISTAADERRALGGPDARRRAHVALRARAPGPAGRRAATSSSAASERRAGAARRRCAAAAPPARRPRAPRSRAPRAARAAGRRAAPCGAADRLRRGSFHEAPRDRERRKE